MTRISVTSAIRATDAAGQYAPALAALRGRSVSGVYAILAARGRSVLYVGESHSGRLYDTITRHFREWNVPKTDPTGRREGGTQYDRNAVLVAWKETPADQAQATQFAEIARLQPRDNTVEGATIQNPGPFDGDKLTPQMAELGRKAGEAQNNGDAAGVRWFFETAKRVGILTPRENRRRLEQAFNDAYNAERAAKQRPKHNPSAERRFAPAHAIEYRRGKDIYRHEFEGPAEILTDGSSLSITGAGLSIGRMIEG